MSAPFDPSQAWSWDSVPHRRQASPPASSPDASHPSEPENARAESEPAEEIPPNDPSNDPDNQRRFKPRTCRICFEDVEPTFEVPNATTQFLGGKPRVRYVSEDPEFGRLMRPCKCKGSQKYVHEGCLRAWRRASPSQRNLWECPTCKYQYRMERLTWGKWASSKIVRAILTLSIMIVTIFLLGFVADPIINLWSDPVGAVLDNLSGAFDELEDLRELFPNEEPNTWSFHFYKGFLSLGLVGLVKSFFAVSPWHFWNIRIGGARRGRGRDRMENISLTLVFIGVVTFLAAVWKGVSALCARSLERFSDRIVDVQGDDDDDDEDEGDGPQPESRKDR